MEDDEKLNFTLMVECFDRNGQSVWIDAGDFENVDAILQEMVENYPGLVGTIEDHEQEMEFCVFWENNEKSFQKPQIEESIPGELCPFVKVFLKIEGTWVEVVTRFDDLGKAIRFVKQFPTVPNKIEDPFNDEFDPDTDETNFGDPIIYQVKWEDGQPIVYENDEATMYVEEDGELTFDEKKLDAALNKRRKITGPIEF